MSITSPQVTIKPLWYKALARPAPEFPSTSLPILSGAIPPGLCGTLYRNGPGRLERAGTRAGHWFDGDGAILAVKFADRAAIGVYRYVQTEGYQAESQVNRWLYGNYGMIPSGKIWERRSKLVKNVANTAVLALPDRLLALWEGGIPHALDLDSLETIGTDSLGFNSVPLIYSAHPKVDPISGHIYNFGVSIGAQTQLNLYESDRSGKVINYSQTKLPRLITVHDFLMVGKYLVFCMPPLEIQPLPILFGLASYSDSIRWKPELGTQILVFDRDNLTLISRSIVETWFQWHFGNGYVDANSNIICDLVRYPDFTTNQFLAEVATGKTKTEAIGTLWQLIINPTTGKLIGSEQLIDRSCEFPVVEQSQVGKEWRYTYLGVHKPDAILHQELVGTIGRFDRQTQTLTTAEIDKHLYPSEPIHVVDRFDLNQSWILTVIYDGENHQSEVWIYDSDKLDDFPVCRLGLPSAIPMGFHGTWRHN
ncbi:carotenoid oxygenase family protein [Chamaesiphon sp. VAR_48_metabat_135_sub]|uniref:carotenoid oxygenase family protein n=1 Tax=Chamaesiphon sp. VAR_48_metabat_135_sub TaxID=2964699 RepID=UPI00286B9CBF|nr:carotenoid oxygenase family protein [Chamaesiphon sp. VAR_48_metabat_135_sub]